MACALLCLRIRTRTGIPRWMFASRAARHCKATLRTRQYRVTHNQPARGSQTQRTMAGTATGAARTYRVRRGITTGSSSRMIGGGVANARLNAESRRAWHPVTGRSRRRVSINTARRWTAGYSKNDQSRVCMYLSIDFV
jgi:hypothetical protein